MTFPDYVARMRRDLSAVLHSGLATTVDLVEAPKGATTGYIRGLVRFLDGSELHLREYLDTASPEPRLMYAYHYQDANARLVFRYDNAAHKPPVSRAEHKHTAEGVLPLSPPPLFEVIREVARHLPAP